ncbi:hypothetical protein ACGE32_34225, partial [Klebsiella pneumoniae]
SHAWARQQQSDGIALLHTRALPKLLPFSAIDSPSLRWDRGFAVPPDRFFMPFETLDEIRAFCRDPSHGNAQAAEAAAARQDTLTKPPGSL